jgi:hypothetical protein
MPDYDAGFKIVARAAGPALGELVGLHCDEWEPIGGEVQATERLADRVFRVRQGRERFIVYLEAYTRWAAAAPWSVLAKSGLLAERERLPVVSLVFVLQRRGYRSQGGDFRLEARGAPTQHVWFEEVCLWQHQPEPWWEEAPGLMPLFPLCRHNLHPRQAIERAATAIADHTRERVQRATLLTTLGIFGRLAYSHLPVLELIGREAMKESPFFDELAAVIRVETTREDVERAIRIRFGIDAATQLKPVLEGISDLDRLTELHELAIRCRRISEFKRSLTADAAAR